MNVPARKRKPTYAGKVTIRHLVEAAKAAGLVVGGIEAAPDGTIRIIDARNMPKPPKDQFEEWDRKELLRSENFSRASTLSRRKRRAEPHAITSTHGAADLA